MRTFDELLNWQVQAARVDKSSAPALAVCVELAAEARYAEFALLLRAWIALRPHQKAQLVEQVPRIVLGDGADPSHVDTFIESQSALVERVRADCLEPHLLPATATALRERFESAVP
jgi:hypothetical protein